MRRVRNAALDGRLREDVQETEDVRGGHVDAVEGAERVFRREIQRRGKGGEEEG